jgi:hypothetical protein
MAPGCHTYRVADIVPDIPILAVDYKEAIDSIAVVDSSRIGGCMEVAAPIVAAGFDTDQGVIDIAAVVVVAQANLKLRRR